MLFSDAWLLSLGVRFLRPAHAVCVRSGFLSAHLPVHGNTQVLEPPPVSWTDPSGKDTESSLLGLLRGWQSGVWAAEGETPRSPTLVMKNLPAPRAVAEAEGLKTSRKFQSPSLP